MGAKYDVEPPGDEEEPDDDPAEELAPDVPAHVEITPPDALARAWASAERIVVAGSIFLLGHVIEELA